MLTITILFPLVFLSAVQGSASVREKAEAAYEKILSKNGLSLGGEINSQYLRSKVRGDAVIDTNYSREITQFTSFDLDMHFRPYDVASARAIFRFYQDWQTYFSTRSRVIAARWISIDGNIHNTLGYNLGDFRQKYSPLTLWTPRLELRYEPEIFSRTRSEIIQEEFLQGNDRNLQGLNLNSARRTGGPVTEFRIDGLGSRLQKVGRLDEGGHHGLLHEPADMDRFLAGGNGEIIFLDNIYLGATGLLLWDDKNSYQLSQYNDSALIGFLFPDGVHDGSSLNYRDSVVTYSTRVRAGRAGVDIAGFLGNKNLKLEWLAEYALSTEDNSLAWEFRSDTLGPGGTMVNVADQTPVPGLEGAALWSDITAGYDSGDSSFGVEVTGRFLHNESGFRNPLAQSPAFVPERIMNTENDSGLGSLYSTFDALNHGVYKYSPSGQTPGYQQAPFTKSSYTNGVFSPAFISGFSGDPVLQLVLPLGLATPNRSGIDLATQWHFKKWIEGTLNYGMYQELDGVVLERPATGIQVTAEKADLTSWGGGMRFHLDPLVGATHPIHFSFSHGANAYQRPMADSLDFGADVKSNLSMAGAYYKFHKKMAVLAGLQMAAVESMVLIDRRLDASTAGETVTEDQMMYTIGGEYSFNEQAFLLLSVGQIFLEQKRASEKTDFSQLLLNAMMKVAF